MKKVFLIGVFIISSISASFAQVSFGPKLGLGVSTLNNTKVSSGRSKSDYKSIITPTVGVVANFQLGNIFALRPELLYLQRGAKTEYTVTDWNGIVTGTGTSTMRISYLELPINLAAGIKAGPGKFEVFAGPSFALALGGKAKASGGGIDETITIRPGKVPTKPNGDAHINPLNVSLNFGLDYKFNNGLFIQAGYNLGLSNISAHYEDSKAESRRNDNVTKASAVNFAVGFLFGGKE